MTSAASCCPFSLAERLHALKLEGKELAKLYRQACERAIGKLPKIGSLVDAEEELLEALTTLRGLSPLLLLDGAEGAGKSSLINALLASAGGDEADVGEAPHVGEVLQEDCAVRVPPSLPIGRPGGRAGRPLIVRALSSAADAAGTRRFLEGRPSLHRASGSELGLRVLAEDEWQAGCLSSSAAPVCGEGDQTSAGSADSGADVAGDRLPLILEDARAARAWCSGMWLAEVNLSDCGSANSRWVSGCADVVCLVRAATGGIGAQDEQRIREHLLADRRVLVVVSACTEQADGDIKAEVVEAVQGIRERLHTEFGDEDLVGMHIVAVPSGKVADSAASMRSRWRECASGFRDFAVASEARRLACASEQLGDAREAFVSWCSKGTKVVVAASAQFQQEADEVRLARDLITQNIDAAYLAHVFSSILIGKFASLCSRLAEAPAPDLGGRWGRHATRQVMERSLRELLEEGLRVAMRESLEEVTTELAKQELPSVEKIQRIAQRNTKMPWDAEVRRLEVELNPDELQHFAMHFFGSLSVGVLSGIGAVALEVLLGELALGPVGVIAGVATFVAIGAQNADWPSVRKDFIRKARSQHVELVYQARDQLNLPGLCERRKRRILEQMDLILRRLFAEVASLAVVASEFAQFALQLQQQQQRRASSC